MAKHEHERNERTFSPEKAERLDNPERQQSLPPEDVVTLLQLEPGMTVADVGAGTGYFSLPMAGAVAPGRVLAVDFQEEMLAMLRQKVQGAGAANVDAIHGEARATGIESGSCHRVLIVNVWHELDRRSEVLEEMRRILRPDGWLAIVDWRTDVEQPPGPPIAHRIPPEAVATELGAEGWNVIRSLNVGTYSYVVAAERVEAN